VQKKRFFSISLLVSFNLIASILPAFAVTKSSYLDVGIKYVIFKYTSASETVTVPYGVSVIDWISIGGGGGGGSDGGGGGGGGEMRRGDNSSVTPGSVYTISVGTGGSGSIYNGAVATAGSATTITGPGYSFQARGGGAGGNWSTSQTIASGGSGGGGGTSSPGGDGGANRYQGTEGIGGVGGDGPVSNIPTGSNLNFGGGGGGGSCFNAISSGNYAGAAGGAGGGGQGAGHTQNVGSGSGSNATANTGGGGGGGAACTNGNKTNGGNGADGVVYARFVMSAPSTPTLTSGSDTGYSNSDQITKDNSPTFTGTAIGGSSVQLQSDGVNTGSACTADQTTGQWSCTASSISDGTHTITAVATLGSATTTSATGLSVTIDTATPTLSSVTTNSAGTQITLTYNAPLLSATIGNDSFTVTVLGVSDTVTSATANSTTVTIAISVPIPTGNSPTISYTHPGTYRTNSIQDVAGNESVSFSGQTITNSSTVVGTSTLTLSITGTLSKLSTVTISATVTSQLSSAGSVTFLNNGRAITRCSGKSVSGTVATCSWKILFQGQQTVAANFTSSTPSSVTGSSSTKYLVVGKRTGSR